MKVTKIALFVIIACSLSCSQYSVKNEISDEGVFKKAKKLGVVLRMSGKNRASYDEVLTNLSRSLTAYTHKKQIDMVPDLSSQITHFADNEDGFFQTSSDSEYLKYKSLGILKTYLRTNSTEIKISMEKNGYDGLIFYEAYSIISPEMQLMRFNTVIAMVDKELNVVYLDHQDNTIEAHDSDAEVLKVEMLNHITKRFVEKMVSFGYLKAL